MRVCVLRALTTVMIVAIVGWWPLLEAGTAWRGMTGGLASHTVVKGETLASIGARFGVEAGTLAADNGLANANLAVGQMLHVDNRHLVPGAVVERVIVVNVPQRMLFYEVDGVVRGLPVAVGQAGWRTPLLPFTVRTKETNPSWEVPVSIQAEARERGRVLPAVVPPGPANPLGQFWLGLSIPSVGIHSTNAPSSIYRATTHGCIRVGPPDMEWLYPRVEVGTTGAIVYEPILLAAVGDEIFLEVHRDVYGRLADDARTIVRAAAREAGLEGQIEWERAEAVIAARHGVARRVGRRFAGGSD